MKNREVFSDISMAFLLGNILTQETVFFNPILRQNPFNNMESILTVGIHTNSRFFPTTGVASAVRWKHPLKDQLSWQSILKLNGQFFLRGFESTTEFGSDMWQFTHTKGNLTQKMFVPVTPNAQTQFVVDRPDLVVLTSQVLNTDALNEQMLRLHGSSMGTLYVQATTS